MLKTTRPGRTRRPEPTTTRPVLTRDLLRPDRSQAVPQRAVSQMDPAHGTPVQEEFARGLRSRPVRSVGRWQRLGFLQAKGLTGDRERADARLGHEHFDAELLVGVALAGLGAAR